MHKPLEDCDVDVATAVGMSPDMAQLHLWRAHFLRDHGSFSDNEMTHVEGAAGALASRARLLWNPFTNEFRTAAIDKHYRSGDFLRGDIDVTRNIISEGY